MNNTALNLSNLLTLYRRRHSQKISARKDQNISVQLNS